MPLTKKNLIDSPSALMLIDQLRMAVPEDVSRATEVLARKDDILNQSLDEARKIRSSAETEYRNKIDDSELTKEAEKEGERIIQEAQQKVQHIIEAADKRATQMLKDADSYSFQILSELETNLQSVMITVQNGLGTLKKSGDLEASKDTETPKKLKTKSISEVSK
jgi:vacuolar-type H+-ATPase subunit H